VGSLRAFLGCVGVSQWGPPALPAVSQQHAPSRTPVPLVQALGALVQMELTGPLWTEVAHEALRFLPRAHEDALAPCISFALKAAAETQQPALLSTAVSPAAYGPRHLEQALGQATIGSCWKCSLQFLDLVLCGAVLCCAGGAGCAMGGLQARAVREALQQLGLAIPPRRCRPSARPSTRGRAWRWRC